MKVAAKPARFKIGDWVQISQIFNIDRVGNGKTGQCVRTLAPIDLDTGLSSKIVEVLDTAIEPYKGRKPKMLWRGVAT